MSTHHKNITISFLLLVVAFLVNAGIAEALVCNSGSLSTTCTVSSSQTLSQDVVANNIVFTGGTLTVTGNTAGNTGRTITANNVTINSAATIRGVGYPAAQGPGKVSQTYRAGGAGHGGVGGDGRAYPGGPAYGTILQPVSLGSGGNGGLPTQGGGAIKFIVTETMTINGPINMDGYHAGSASFKDTGGSSGGSVWIQAGMLAGSGSITARGGNADTLYKDSGGGAGGRIALYYDIKTYSGTLSVAGGTGYNAGGVGTMFESQGGAYICNTPITATMTSSQLSQFSSLVVDKGCNLRINGNTQFQNVRVGDTSSSTLKLYGNINISGDLNLSSSSTVDMIPNTGSNLGFMISANNINIPSGSKIIGIGYPAGEGPGKVSQTYRTGGAGHGGVGGGGKAYPGGPAYGSSLEPVSLGSGGNGGLPAQGGGAVKIIADETLTVNGLINMDGYHAGSGSFKDTGGSSGGSVWIQAGRLVGSGSITARGGHAETLYGDSGGGSGGRIAIYYQNMTAWAGSVIASGGNGYQQGSAGSIYYEQIIPPVPPIYEKFSSHPETTNFSMVNPRSVSAPVLSDSNAKVQWNAVGMNLNGVNLDSAVDFAPNFVSVRSDLLQVLNTTATIEFKNINYAGIESFNVLKNGELCVEPECVKISANPATIEVDGFSNYTTQDTGEIPEFNTITLLLALSSVIIASIAIRKKRS